mgnify:CR=1 FL=1
MTLRAVNGRWKEDNPTTHRAYRAGRAFYREWGELPVGDDAAHELMMVDGLPSDAKHVAAFTDGCMDASEGLPSRFPRKVAQ